jgi:hypothetical protein
MLEKYVLTVLAAVLEEVAGKRHFSEKFYGLYGTAKVISVYKKNRMYKQSPYTALSICKTATCFGYIYSHHQVENRNINKKL